MKSQGHLLEKTRTGQPTRAGILDRLARAALRKSLARITQGSVTLTEAGQSQAFGEADAQLRAGIKVNDPAFYRRAAFGGSVGAAEAYMDGQWDCDDLAALVRIFVRSEPAKDSLEAGLARLSLPLQRLLHRLNDNTRRGSRRNIAAHYDLGNDLYRLCMSFDLFVDFVLKPLDTFPAASA